MHFNIYTVYIYFFRFPPRSFVLIIVPWPCHYTLCPCEAVTYEAPCKYLQCACPCSVLHLYVQPFRASYKQPAGEEHIYCQSSLWRRRGVAFFSAFLSCWLGMWRSELQRRGVVQSRSAHVAETHTGGTKYS